jgi:mono/diheme cytochrome c family protein
VLLTSRKKNRLAANAGGWTRAVRSLGNCVRFGTVVPSGPGLSKAEAFGITSSRNWVEEGGGCWLPQGGLLLSLCAVFLFVFGCNIQRELEFPLNLEGRDPAEVSLLAREEATHFLEELFGTPDYPRVPRGVSLNEKLLQMAAGEPSWQADERGIPSWPRGLYRQHCSVCHGIAGDGAGPAALIMDPYPRDFRLGIFMYTSTIPGAKPRREDIRRIIVEGMPGTAMPAFKNLLPEAIEALVEYVIYLSIRGETELLILQAILDEEEPLPLSFPLKERIIQEDVAWIWEQWSLPQNFPDRSVVVPPPPPPIGSRADWEASVARGREIYLSERAQCAKCHGPEGAGDGEQAGELYDDWNYPKRGPTPAHTAQRARLYTLPLRALRVRNFREGVFRGGSRPEDLYLRIAIGLKGTPMGGVGPTPESKGALEPEEIWDLVHFVMAQAGLKPPGL